GVVHTKVNAVVLFRFIDKKIFQNVLPVATQSVRPQRSVAKCQEPTHGNAAKDPWSARSIRSPHRRVQVPMAPQSADCQNRYSWPRANGASTGCWGLSQSKSRTKAAFLRKQFALSVAIDPGP